MFVGLFRAPLPCVWTVALTVCLGECKWMINFKSASLILPPPPHTSQPPTTLVCFAVPDQYSSVSLCLSPYSPGSLVNTSLRCWNMGAKQRKCGWNSPLRFRPQRWQEKVDGGNGNVTLILFNLSLKTNNSNEKELPGWLSCQYLVNALNRQCSGRQQEPSHNWRAPSASCLRKKAATSYKNISSYIKCCQPVTELEFYLPRMEKQNQSVWKCFYGQRSSSGFM